jgi:tRNA threonylcarbamoyladenosine biosynthesis protein TsaB
VQPDDDAPAAGRRLATMDAMRGERYASLLTFGARGELLEVGPVELLPAADVAGRAAALGAGVIGADGTPPRAPEAGRALAALDARGVHAAPVPLDAWEPTYGRVAEAQARWEAAHGRPLPRG